MNQLLFGSAKNELMVYECGKEECVKDKAIALTIKNYHLFHYVVAGKGTLILNNNKYVLSKGAIFYIPPETDAVYFPDKEDPWTYIWVGFGGSLADDYLNYLNINIDNPIIFDNKKIYKNYFEKIVARYKVYGYLDLYSLGTIYQLFSDLLITKDGKEEIKNNKTVIQIAKEFIHNNYQFNITVNDIAKNANVTPNYLSYLFHSVEGMSTKQYLIKVRMEKAMKFILSGEFKIKEVAMKVGYSNQLHFCNEFRRYYGYPPTHYLKK